MSVAPILTFKAGLCDLDTSSTPAKVRPLPTPGYLYLYADDDLLHLCWRPRSAALTHPELDLLMLPTDGSFTPYHPSSSETPSNPQKPTNGRIYVLRFGSSSSRHLFWLQSRSQHPQGDPAWFSARDLKLGQIVNNLLQGEEVNVQEQLAGLPADQNGPDEDEPMEDVEGTNPDPNRQSEGGGGGAGAGATGGDIREEGNSSREGGADGGRAAAAGGQEANTLVQNFLQAMQQRGQGQPQPQEKLFTTLADLLTPASTIPLLDSADEELMDRLCECLPPQLLGNATGSARKDILRRVLHSPQFSQSLASLTVALREGGLPIISETIGIPVRNGGYLRHGGVPMGGGEAVEAFIEGVKKDVEEKSKQGDSGDRMDED